MDAVEEVVRAQVEAGLSAGLFPGAQVAWAMEGGPSGALEAGWTCAAATCPEGHARRAVGVETLFDLASLTKGLVTAPLVWYAVGVGALGWDAPVARWLPDWSDHGTTTVRHLLTHTSGLAAWVPVYAQVQDAPPEARAEAMWTRILTAKREAAPGTQACYSDLGYMLLGRLLERCLGAPLDVLARRHVFAPLGMDGARFVRHLEGEKLGANVAATEATEAARQGPSLAGQVHDENAWTLGGVAGHAGLFGTARDVGRFAQALLDADRAPGPAWAIPPAVVRAALSQAGATRAPDGRPLGSHPGGLDTPSGPSSTAGPHVTRAPLGVTAGHLGFTGTSFWAERARRAWVVLLTNRVHPDRSRGAEMRAFRVAFHTAVFDALRPRRFWSCPLPTASLTPPSGPHAALPAHAGALDAAIEAARAAGALARAKLADAAGGLGVRHKGDVDLVTEVDTACEARIVSMLRARFPAYRFLAEEDAAHDATGAGAPRWIIDPIDGTTNFSHRLPHFAVSIALEVDGCVVVGVVYDPARDELFTATRLGGARLNGRPIRATACRDLGSALVATGFPYDRRSNAHNNSAEAAAALRAVQGLRRAGSAALDLAYVAAGRLDAYWEMRLSPWDVAAGALLVEEAGGRLSQWDAATPWTLDAPEILASGGGVHDALSGLLMDVGAARGAC